MSFIGFADATYLTVEHYLGAVVPCSATHGCETVLTSQYATIFGIPISLIGALFYLVVLSFALLLVMNDELPQWVLRALRIITGAGFLVAAYLFYLQFAIIHAVCQYCFVSDSITILLFPLSLLLSPCKTIATVA